MYNALTTVHYGLLIATNNKLFFTRELQNLERVIQENKLANDKVGSKLVRAWLPWVYGI